MNCYHLLSIYYVRRSLNLWSHPILIPTLRVRCCYYPPILQMTMVKKYAPGHSSKQQRWAPNPVTPESALLSSVMGLLLCTSWFGVRTFSAKSSHFTYSLGTEEDFLKCSEHSWKLRKTNRQEETQEWVSVSNLHTGIGKSRQGGGGAVNQRSFYFLPAPCL